MTRKFVAPDRPEKFDLKNYDNLTSMDVAGWFEQIRVRCVIGFTPTVDNDLGPIMGKVMRDPLGLAFTNPLMYPELWNIGTAVPQLSGRQHTAVSSLTMTDAQNLTYWMQSKNINEPRPWTGETIELWDRQALDDVNAEQIDQWLHPTIATLRINLEADREVVKKEVSAFFTAARKMRGIRGAGGKIEPAKWCQQRLLPYFDLTHWARSQHAEWTDDALAELLFPDDLTKTGKQISDTVRPNANALITERMRERLALEAAKEGKSPK